MLATPDLETSIIRALRGNGYKATPQRIAISQLALASHDHPTAQRIHSQVRRSYPTVSLATVYKTIQILQGVGLVQELNLPQDLVCQKCGDISDWQD